MATYSKVTIIIEDEGGKHTLYIHRVKDAQVNFMPRYTLPADIDESKSGFLGGITRQDFSMSGSCYMTEPTGEIYRVVKD